ncbi:MAG: DnaJ domain-containing protein [Halioglobus sp.]|nr:DnaJ domain-containing protein [Halioglobus sp.]
MPRLILLVAVIAVIYLLLRRVQTMPPHQRRSEYIKLGLGSILFVTVVLAATGRMHWVGAGVTALLVTARQALPLLIRLFPVLANLRNRGAPSAGTQSTVETSLLRMQLDHDSGALEGEVLQGTFKGWRLAEMNRQQLEQFHTYCQSEDADSLRLLASYLQQRFPNEGPFEQQADSQTDSDGPMSRTQALAVLGLEDGASEEDIVAAHRKLIQKLHPDRGGNDYLAAQINQAKDILLS